MGKQCRVILDIEYEDVYNDHLDVFFDEDEAILAYVEGTVESNARFDHVKLEIIDSKVEEL